MTPATEQLTRWLKKIYVSAAMSSATPSMAGCSREMHGETPAQEAARPLGAN
jgi:hypothetical protein